MKKTDIIPIITEIAGLMSGTNATLATALTVVNAVTNLANMFLKKNKEDPITDEEVIAAMRAGFEGNVSENDARIEQLNALLTDKKGSA